MKRERHKEKIYSRAENVAKCDAIRKRVERVLTRCGYTWSRGIWKYFDSLLIDDIPQEAVRQKVLKRLFSKWGSGILQTDGRYVEMIEKKLFKTTNK